jgi:hypothetical protein
MIAREGLNGAFCPIEASQRSFVLALGRQGPSAALRCFVPLTAKRQDGTRKSDWGAGTKHYLADKLMRFTIVSSALSPRPPFGDKNGQRNLCSRFSPAG